MARNSLTLSPEWKAMTNSFLVNGGLSSVNAVSGQSPLGQNTPNSDITSFPPEVEGHYSPGCSPGASQARP